MHRGSLGWFFALALAFQPNPKAHAVSDQFLDGRVFDLSKLTPAEPACDSICSVVVDTATGKGRTLDGAIGWSEADDQWCANHSVGTNPTILPVQVAPATGVTCNVPMLTGDTSCSDVNRRLQHCKLKGSQIESQCAAYIAIKDVSKSEKVVMGLDSIAAGTCGLACAGNFVPGGQALVAACGVAGSAASTAQLVETLKAKSSTVQKYIGIAGGGLGAALSAASLVDGFEKTADGANPARTSPNGKPYDKGASCKAAVVFAALSGVRAYNMKQQIDSKKSSCKEVRELVAGALSADFAQPASSSAQGTTSTSSGTSTSGTARASGGYPTLTARDEAGAVTEAATYVRNNYPQFFGAGRTRAEAYNMMTEVINILRANGHDVARTLAHPDQGPENPYRWGSDAVAYKRGSGYQIYDIYLSWPDTASPQAAEHGTTTQAEVTGDLVALNSGVRTNVAGGPARSAATAGVSAAQLYGKCLSDSRCTNEALASAGAEGELLRSSGLAKLLMPRVSQIPMDRIERHLESGGSADALISMAMNGSSGGFGPQLAQIAKGVQGESQTLSGALGFASPRYVASRSSGSQFRLTSEPSLMPSRSVAGGETGFKAQTAVAGSTVCDPSDIWHSNCEGDPSIFEIVSEKLVRSRDRVESLGWSLDMNRKLSGEK